MEGIPIKKNFKKKSIKKKKKKSEFQLQQITNVIAELPENKASTSKDIPVKFLMFQGMLI